MFEIRLFEESDLRRIHQFLLDNLWPFHMDDRITQEGLESRGFEYFSSDSSRTFVCLDDQKLVGFIRFYDLSNSDTCYPSFDIRVAQDHRGRGIGQNMLLQGIKAIFQEFDQIRRIVCETRFDNLGMQKALEKVGFRKEAVYLKEWKINATNTFVDSYGYAILREEVL